MIMVPFIAEQYTERQPKVKVLKTGKRVITDRPLTLQYIYNMYYWIGNVGSLSWFAMPFFERYCSFNIAYTITFASIVIAMLMNVEPESRAGHLKLPILLYPSTV
jgi:POT family proton-dependent oligopeptide transporter